MKQAFKIKIPIRIESEANMGGKRSGRLISSHWSQKFKRNRTQKFCVGLDLLASGYKPNLPCCVKLVRIAPRNLDEDNLIYAFKKIKDVVADYIIPGLAPGRADGDKRIKWEYDQEKGEPKEYAIRIEIIS